MISRRSLVGPALTAVVVAAAPPSIEAQGHGPIYGLSTPTLGRGGWSVDVASMARLVESREAAMIRPMLSYGLTEDIQVSASFPVPLAGNGLPAMRGLARMPMAADVQAMLGWRFHRTAPSVGKRWESTAWLGLEVPTDEERAGVETSPGAYVALVTGRVSRSWYAWAGAAHRRSRGSGMSRSGDLWMGSVVVGYRPPVFRDDRARADWRVFLEVVGEWAGRDEVLGETRDTSGGRRIFAGVTFLGLYGWWGISGGPAIPVHQNRNGTGPEERLLLVLNVSFWF
ncbi:MAG: hypothetical protein R3266_06890 [Gemmatimonadota bacterium]|nr:hypothetical protein [Gemmatimonadota bacterium]